MGEVPPHLHGDVGHEDQEAERLNALGQAAGCLPGVWAVAHVRGARERGRGLNEGQSQDQENGETQNPGKGTETTEARTSHTRGLKEQIDRQKPRRQQGRLRGSKGRGPHLPLRGHPCVVRPHTPGPNSGATTGRKSLERSPHHRGALSASAPVRRGDGGSSSTPGRGACLPPETPPRVRPQEPRGARAHLPLASAGIVPPVEPQRPGVHAVVDGAILEWRPHRAVRAPSVPRQPVQGSPSPHDTSTVRTQPGDHRVGSMGTGGSWPPSKVGSSQAPRFPGRGKTPGGQTPGPAGGRTPACWTHSCAHSHVCP